MYYLILGILGLISFFDFNNKKNRGIFFLILIAIITIDGIRYEIGTDWGPYKFFYEQSIKNFETGYEIYIFFIKKIAKDYQQFVLIHSIITNTLIYFSVYYISGYSLTSVLLSYSLLSTILGSNRQLLAMGIVFFGVYNILKNNKIGWLLITISPLIHVSSIIVFPFFIFKKIMWKNTMQKTLKIIYLTIVVKIFIRFIIGIIIKNIVINLRSNADDLYNIYQNYKFSYTKLAITYCKYSILNIIATINKVKISKVEKILIIGNIYTYLLLFLFWQDFQILAGRGSYYNIVLFIYTLVGSKIKNSKNNIIKLISIIIIIMYSFFTFQRGIILYENEFIPYKTIFNKK